MNANKTKKRRTGEGLALENLLKQSGRRPKDLADALGYHASSVTKYMNSAEFDNLMWRSIRRGLEALNINPRLIRPDDELTNQETANLRDLRPLAAAFNIDQLKNLREILLASEGSRQSLLVYYIADRLAGEEVSPEVLLQQKKQEILDAAMKEIASLEMFTSTPLPPARLPQHAESSTGQSSVQTHGRRQRGPANGR